MGLGSCQSFFRFAYQFSNKRHRRVSKINTTRRLSLGRPKRIFALKHSEQYNSTVVGISEVIMSPKSELSSIESLIERNRSLESRRSRRSVFLIATPLISGMLLLGFYTFSLRAKVVAEREAIQAREMFLQQTLVESKTSEKVRTAQIQQLEEQLKAQASIRTQLGELQKKLASLEQTNASLNASATQLAEIKAASANFDEKARLSLIAHKFIGALATDNPRDLEDIFADKVDYYEFGRLTRRQVEEDLARDRSKWPYRTFTISGDIQQRQIRDSEWEVTFPVEYILLNQDRQPSTGSLKITLICEGANLQITTVKRAVVKAKKSNG